MVLHGQLLRGQVAAVIVALHILLAWRICSLCTGKRLLRMLDAGVHCSLSNKGWIHPRSLWGSHHPSMSACSSTAQDHAPSQTNSMEDPKQVSLPNASEAFMKAADVLLVLDDGTAVLCHSQILSMHSAVICNMLADLAQHEGKVSVPLPEFTEAQCSALLAYLYANTLTSRGAAFETHGRADLDAAVIVARFAHTYDAPHALRHVEAYLRAFMGTFEKSCVMTAKAYDPDSCTFKDFMTWAVMAENFDMHELRCHCERAMMRSWEYFQDKPDMLDQLSRSAFQRIATGLNTALLASEKYQPGKALVYPAVQDVIAWGQHKQSKEQ